MYKEVTDFIKKIHVCDMDVISTEDIITYVSLVKEAMHENRNLVDSKWWEPATNKNISKCQSLLHRVYTVAIDQSINKTLYQFHFNNCRSGNCSGSGEESS